MNRLKYASAILLTTAMAGCASFQDKLASTEFLGSPQDSIDGSPFKKQYYGGVGLGPSFLSPDTAGTSFTADSSREVQSNMKIGYDLTDRIAVEFDSIQHGEAELGQGVSAVQYSSFGLSAIRYGLTDAVNRFTRQGLNPYARLGVAQIERSSNVVGLDDSSTQLAIGAGVEYGMNNGMGLRAEATRYDSETSALGIGFVFRFGDLKRILPADMLNEPQRSVYVVGDKEAAAAVINDRAVMAGDSVVTVPSSAVKVLANVNDHDGDGINNKNDQCKQTRQGTSVGSDGCGLFDGKLANSSFAHGSAGLNAPMKASLDRLAMQLIAFPEVRVSIEAHTDDKGPDEINQLVSESRAEAVRNYLVRRGVSARQLAFAGKGESFPIADNSTAAGRDANRRIEIVTLPDLDLDVNEYKEPEPRQSLQAKAQSDRGVIPAKSIELGPVLAAARSDLPIIPAPRYIPGLRINGVLDDVSFEPGTARLTAESQQTLLRLASELKKADSVRVAIMVHTNTQADADQNLQLSMKQARAVVKELVKDGVNRRRLKAEGYGDSLPRYQNITERHQSFNRRVEVRVLD